MPSFDVACVADMCVDLILSGNIRPQFNQVEQLIGDYQLEVGGSANIFASQMAKLGLRTAVIGHLGEDTFGRFLHEHLIATGVDTSLVRQDSALRTGLGVASTEPGDRAILTFPGTIAHASPADLPTAPGALTRHWHIASYFLLERLRPAWKEFLARLRIENVSTSLDPNWDPADTWEGLLDLLPALDVFLPNEAEALAVSRERDVVSAGRMLSSYGPLVVIKCGREGAIAVRGDRVWKLAPSRLGEMPVAVVDTIGAGDNFDAGFMSCWLQEMDIEDCLLMGHRCAVASLARAGGIAGQLRENVHAPVARR